MIEVRDLVVRKNGATICAIDNLSVGSGERVGIVGANGSGKTTLLRVLAGLEREFDGDCRVAAARRQRVYVHQSPYLFRGTVLYNVKYGLRSRGEHGSAVTDRAMSWLERLGVASLAHRSGANLSGGEKRRVALARALVLAPSLLLLDEPLAEMDDDGIAAVKTALGKLDDTTVLIASPTDLSADIVTRTHRPAIAGDRHQA